MDSALGHGNVLYNDNVMTTLSAQAIKTPCNDDTLGHDNAPCNNNACKKNCFYPTQHPTYYPTLQGPILDDTILSEAYSIQRCFTALTQSQSDQQQPSSSSYPNWYRSPPSSTQTSAFHMAQIHRWTHSRNVQLSNIIWSLLKPQSQSISISKHH